MEKYEVKLLVCQNIKKYLVNMISNIMLVYGYRRDTNSYFSSMKHLTTCQEIGLVGVVLGNFRFDYQLLLVSFIVIIDYKDQ